MTGARVPFLLVLASCLFLGSTITAIFPSAVQRLGHSTGGRFQIPYIAKRHPDGGASKSGRVYVPRQQPPMPSEPLPKPNLYTWARDVLGYGPKERDRRLGPGPGFEYSMAELKRRLADEQREQEAANGQVLEKRQALTGLGIDTASMTASASGNGTNSTDLSDVWVLQDVYEGSTFFDYWDFWNYADKTNGLVAYVDRDTAFGDQLAYVRSDGKVVMKADNTTTLNLGDWRKSIRIESAKTYTGGLFIIDMDKAPYGCGIWPAFWTSTGNWPYDGEIDVYEGVHVSTNNQVAWHTDDGCDLTVPGNFSGNVKYTDCNAFLNDNNGCAISDASASSSGSTFANLGGGVYAMKWDDTGIAVWFFPRSVIPDDIATFRPDPANWGTPSANLSPSACNIIKHFQTHKIIINITFCGDWAGGASYTASGCPGTCPEQVTNPENFNEAYWLINYVRVYTNARIESGILNDAPSRFSSLLTAKKWSVLLGFGLGLAFGFGYV